MIPRSYEGYRQLRKSSREPTPVLVKPTSVRVVRVNGNASTSSQTRQNTASSSSNSSSRSPPKNDKPDPDYDISQEFLDSLQSLTRDFEHQHATILDDAAKFLTVSPLPPRPPSRKGNGNANVTLEGFQFFHPSPQATRYSRPSTVPRYLGKNAVGDGPNKHDGKASGKPRALARSKVESHSHEENILPRTPVRLRGRPMSAHSSGSESSLLISESEDNTRPSSASKRVTFAADTVNYERENKPARRRKMPKRRRQGFPHPSRGIFVPPDIEIVESSGPGGSCRDNPYLNFNQVWTHPAARSTGESNNSKLHRTERFHRLMSDLEHAHIHYNRLANNNNQQNEYLTQCIFKRYILVLDLALTEGHIAQVEHLLETISKSIPVLHQNVFYYLYSPKVQKEVDINNNTVNNSSSARDDHSCFHQDLVLASYALNRISGDLPRQDVTKMSIETVLVKLCMELIEVVYSPYGSLVFRDALSTLPYTVRQAITLLKTMRTSRDSFCYIKWINNSAIQRDFRTILKNLGLLDRHGCIADPPGVEKHQFAFTQQRKPNSTTTNAKTSSSAGSVKRGNKGPSSLNTENRRVRVVTS